MTSQVARRRPQLIPGLRTIPPMSLRGLCSRCLRLANDSPFADDTTLGFTLGLGEHIPEA